jgi:hypothetical protein
MKQSSWTYYGVKIIKQIIVEGEPDKNLLDEYYDDEEQTFEESIMLVRAQSSENACKIAENKTTEFDEPYQNKYGQQVTWKLIGIVDCFLITDKLISGTEVYSCLHTTNKNETANDFIKKWFNNNKK